MLLINAFSKVISIRSKSPHSVALPSPSHSPLCSYAVQILQPISTEKHEMSVPP